MEGCTVDEDTPARWIWRGLERDWYEVVVVIVVQLVDLGVGIFFLLDDFDAGDDEGGDGGGTGLDVREGEGRAVVVAQEIVGVAHGISSDGFESNSADEGDVVAGVLCNTISS